MLAIIVFEQQASCSYLQLSDVKNLSLFIHALVCMIHSKEGKHPVIYKKTFSACYNNTENGSGSNKEHLNTSESSRRALLSVIQCRQHTVLQAVSSKVSRTDKQYLTIPAARNYL